MIDVFTVMQPYGLPVRQAGGEADLTTADNTQEASASPWPERRDYWRLLAQSKLAQGAALFAMALPSVVACDSPDQPPATGGVEQTTGAGSFGPDVQGAAPNTLPKAMPECYRGFTELDAVEQEDCRLLVAHMDIADVRQLTGLDQARWANYYRHAVVGEGLTLQTTLPLITVENNPEDTARNLLGFYHSGVNILSWLMQHDSPLSQDPRTALALLGNEQLTSDGYQLAQALARYGTKTDLPLSEFAVQGNPSLYSATPESIAIQHKGSVYKATFVATTGTATGPQKQAFAFTLHPYKFRRNPDRSLVEGADDPHALVPGGNILAGLPQIRTTTA